MAPTGKRRGKRVLTKVVPSRAKLLKNRRQRNTRTTTLRAFTFGHDSSADSSSAMSEIKGGSIPCQISGSRTSKGKDTTSQSSSEETGGRRGRRGLGQTAHVAHSDSGNTEVFTGQEHSKIGDDSQIENLPHQTVGNISHEIDERSGDDLVIVSQNMNEPHLESRVHKAPAAKKYKAKGRAKSHPKEFQPKKYVRLWQGGSTRCASDIIDLDVVLTEFENVACQFKTEIEDQPKSVSQAVDSFMHQLTMSIIREIDLVSEVKFLETSNRKVIIEKKKLRDRLMRLKRDYRSICHQISEIRERYKLDEEKDILQSILESQGASNMKLASDIPKTLQELYDAIANKQAMIGSLNKLRELNDRLEDFVEKNKI